MNEMAIEKAGTRPIAPMLATIAKVRDVTSLSAAIAALHAAGFGVLFSFGPTQDALDARQVIAGLDQGGRLEPYLGLFSPEAATPLWPDVLGSDRRLRQVLDLDATADLDGVLLGLLGNRLGQGDHVLRAAVGG